VSYLKNDLLKDASMEIVTDNLTLWLIAMFVIGFVFAWITCKRC